jgi:magnesium transporter
LEKYHHSKSTDTNPAAQAADCHHSRAYAKTTVQHAATTIANGTPTINTLLSTPNGKNTILRHNNAQSALRDGVCRSGGSIACENIARPALSRQARILWLPEIALDNAARLPCSFTPMFNRRYQAPGTPPATLVSKGDADLKPVITLIEYGPDTFDEKRVENVEELARCKESGLVSWINIDGIGDAEMLTRLGEIFGLHPLALEDVQNTGQRPKLEQYNDHFFIIAQMVDCEDHEVHFEQLALFLKKNVLITIQEEPLHDALEPVRVRLRSGRGFARTRGHDYLAYALLDSVTDHFFPVLEFIGERLDGFEDRMLEKPSRTLAMELHEVKRTLLHLRRSIWPVREVFSGLGRDESGLISEDAKVFVRDCYDHTIQIMDVVESYRDIASGLLELYLSSVSTRTNEIMRVLTVISSIFIPLTFMAGVYGMNFENMPELKTADGYYILLSVMALTATAMALFFKRKGWL